MIQTIQSIQYIRGLAALMVVWYHAQQQLSGYQGWFPEIFDELGYSGVDIFFVISGFIMTITTRNKEVTPYQFMVRRFARVAPLYWFLSLLMVGAALLQPSLFKTLIVNHETLLKSLFFIPHYSLSFPDSIWPILVPGWTLNYEMFFYIIFALCLLRPVPQRLLLLIIIISALVGLNVLFGPYKNAIFAIYTSPLLVEFCLGAIIGELYASGKLGSSSFKGICALLLGGTILLLRSKLPAGLHLEFLGASLVITGALSIPLLNANNHYLKILGDASYSIYLSHIFTLGVLRVFWIKLGFADPSLQLVIAWMASALLSCSLAGVLCYRWIEKPLSNIFFSSRKSYVKQSKIS